LLTQGEIFQDERLSMDEEAAQEASEQGHPGILAGVGKSNDFRRDGVFADYDSRCGENAMRSFTLFRPTAPCLIPGLGHVAEKIRRCTITESDESGHP
jgi:hypothetical protein